MDSENNPEGVRKRVNDLGHVDLDKYVFFPVSVSKLVLMYMVTLGLYQLYWFYKNWMVIREREEREECEECGQVLNLESKVSMSPLGRYIHIVTFA